MSETVKIVSVGPTLAKQWLKDHGYKKNRAINKDRVREYAELMAAGRWKTSGEFAISFDTNGDLINAHHRLEAVILYGKPVDFVVRHNVDAEVLQYIDTHQKRSSAQVGRMLGVDTSSDDALRLINVWLTKQTGRVTELRLEHLRTVFADAIALVGKYTVQKHNGRRLRAGTRAGLIALAFENGDVLVPFLMCIGPVFARESAEPRAVVNLAKWLDNNGSAGQQFQIANTSVVVNSYEQFSQNAKSKQVMSSSLMASESATAKLFERIRVKLEAKTLPQKTVEATEKLIPIAGGKRA